MCSDSVIVINWYFIIHKTEVEVNKEPIQGQPDLMRLLQ